MSIQQQHFHAANGQGRRNSFVVQEVRDVTKDEKETMLTWLIIFSFFIYFSLERRATGLNNAAAARDIPQGTNAIWRWQKSIGNNMNKISRVVHARTTHRALFESWIKNWLIALPLLSLDSVAAAVDLSLQWALITPLPFPHPAPPQQKVQGRVVRCLGGTD
jgi:hypothetical protein